ncbi:hypothetical protein CONLIGDRAFT_634331 [Coniochaeta ligniaria NRRL 30616]|uniref:Protamine P1 n=1 Tax=Coniochaeta ligniaria NRRL 30616 TaxID=1408157 RepID=A0A1J7J3Z5_9PEZI|nr:hypothetical protein CONLIGDRAFT_634331 [Coniochaeta ligniaria NRRL 30616]
MDTTRRPQPLQSNRIAPIDVDEVLYSGSDDEYYDGPAQRLRQYELQKQRFLQGRSLTIISAQLRGPFTKKSGWQNPWLGKSNGISGTQHGATEPVAQSSPISRLDNAAVYVPDPTSRNDAREFGRAPVTVGPFKIDRLTQSSSCHLASPVSSSLYGTTIHPYMDSDAWYRVQTWRADVAATAVVENMQAVVAPVQTTCRSKRPASSELLRNALAKKMRPSGLDQSIREPMSPIGENTSPVTGQRQGSDTPFSTPDIQSLRGSHISPNHFSEAALDGSVAGKTSISRAAQRNASLAGDSVAEKGFSTPTRPAVGGANMMDVLATPAQQSWPLSTGQRSGAIPKAFSPERSPLRSNGMKTNAKTNVGNVTQDSRKGQVIRETVGLGSSVKVTEAQEGPALDFCSQADRSFQYRSKAPKVNKRRALLDAQRNVFHSSSSTETDSEDTESEPVEVPSKESKEAYAPNTFTEQDKTTTLEDARSSSNTTNDTTVTAEEAADTTAPGIDGPTLIPTSSAPSQQQAAPPYTSRSAKGVGAETHIRRKATDHGDHALPEPKSITKPNTSPNKLVKIISQEPPPMVVKPYADAQTSKQDSIVSMDVNLLPTSPSHLGSRVDQGGEVNPHEQPPSQDRGATLKSARSPKRKAVLPSPQRQSPWAKETIHITLASPRPQFHSPTQQTHIQEPVRSELNETPRGSNPAATSVQQSPWTKDNILPTVDIIADMPSVPLADYATQVLQDTEAVEATASQNPWLFDERPGEEADLLGKRPPLPTSPQRLRRTGGATSSPILTKHSLVEPSADTVDGDAPTKQAPPSTPTQQSSLPTPDLTSSLKSFRDFMSPSPEPRRRSRPVRSPKARIEKSDRRKSSFSKGRKGGANRTRLRVSFALPGEDARSSPVSKTDPDETLDGAELPTREATSPSLVRQAAIQAPSRRASSPPLELSQSELPAEGTKFSKFFYAQARKGPQVKRSANYKPLLPSASQQTCGSPEPDAMAEAFIEADRTRWEQDGGVDGSDPSEEGEGEEEQIPDAEQMSTQEEETDDVTAVLDNLGDFLTSFDVDAELDKARREEQQRERPQEMGLGFPSTQDQMEIMGAGVWD